MTAASHLSIVEQLCSTRRDKIPQAYVWISQYLPRRKFCDWDSCIREDRGMIKNTIPPWRICFLSGSWLKISFFLNKGCFALVMIKRSEYYLGSLSHYCLSVVCCGCGGNPLPGVTNYAHKYVYLLVHRLFLDTSFLHWKMWTDWEQLWVITTEKKKKYFKATAYFA